MANDASTRLLSKVWPHSYFQHQKDGNVPSTRGGNSIRSPAESSARRPPANPELGQAKSRQPRVTCRALGMQYSSSSLRARSPKENQSRRRTDSICIALVACTPVPSYTALTGMRVQADTQALEMMAAAE